MNFAMEDTIVTNEVNQDFIDLPPGFRFHPRDEEIISHYLIEKVINRNFSSIAIGEADLNKCEPWDLPDKAKMGEKEWYFFCQRDRKYPTGTRTNRATGAGYWKATGKDKEIFEGKSDLIGMKKTLVFYKGRAPRGEKSNWVMHEYRLEGKFSYYNLPKGAKDDWVVCRVFHKNTEIKKNSIPCNLSRMNYFGDEFMDHASLPPLMDPTSFNRESEFKAINKTPIPSSNFNPQISIRNPMFFRQEASDSYTSDFRNYDEAILRALGANGGGGGDIEHMQCKMEPFSSHQSMVSPSQDTGLSNDMNNNEISSMISNSIELGTSKFYDGVEDFECLWNY